MVIKLIKSILFNTKMYLYQLYSRDDFWDTDKLIPTNCPQLYHIRNNQLFILYFKIVDQNYIFTDKNEIIASIQCFGGIDKIKNTTVKSCCICNFCGNANAGYLFDQHSYEFIICDSCYFRHKSKKIRPVDFVYIVNTQRVYVSNIKYFNAIRVLRNNQIQLLYTIKHFNNHWIHYPNLIYRPWFQIEHDMCMWCENKKQTFPSVCDECYQFSLSTCWKKILGFYYLKLIDMPQDVMNIIYLNLLTLYNFKNVNLHYKNIKSKIEHKPIIPIQRVETIEEIEEDLITEDNLDFFVQDYDDELGVWSEEN